MIKADFLKNDEGFKLRIEGHSDYAECGKDVVCAAVSGVFYALCGYLVNFKHDSFHVRAFESGLVDIELDEDCESFLQLACLGLWQIALKFPSNLTVNNKAWLWRMSSPRNI